MWYGVKQFIKDALDLFKLIVLFVLIVPISLIGFGLIIGWEKIKKK